MVSAPGASGKGQREDSGQTAESRQASKDLGARNLCDWAALISLEAGTKGFCRPQENNKEDPAPSLLSLSQRSGRGARVRAILQLAFINIIFFIFKI